MLSGDNSILSQAGRARDITGEKSIAERVQLAYLAALANGKGNIERANLLSELQKEFGADKIQDGDIDSGLTKVTIDEKDYNFDGTVAPGDGEGGGGNSGLVEQADGTFKDSNNNEWVWIEVPKTVTQSATTDDEIYNALRGYCEPVITTVTSGSDYKATTCGWTDEWYAWDTSNNTVIPANTATAEQKLLTNGCGLNYEDYNTTKSKMLNSIKDNGGFYIGKYETGNEGGTLNKTYYDDDDNVVESTDDYSWYEGTWSGGAAVIKQNQIPYNWVTCSQAQNLAKGLAPEGKTTSLLFGIQWDLVLKFIKVKENLSDNTILTSNSTTWGNYRNNNSTNGTFNITSEHAMASSDYGASYSAITKGAEKSGTKLLTIGSSTSLAKQNIYDFAGNVAEWTVEQSSDSSGVPCAARGGRYHDDGDGEPASCRYHSDPTYSGDDIGFRVALY